MVLSWPRPGKRRSVTKSKSRVPKENETRKLTFLFHFLLVLSWPRPGKRRSVTKSKKKNKKKVNNIHKSKAKSISKSYCNNIHTHNYFKKVLFHEINNKAEFYRISLKNGKLQTILQTKDDINNFNDKRHMIDNLTSKPHEINL